MEVANPMGTNLCRLYSVKFSDGEISFFKRKEALHSTRLLRPLMSLNEEELGLFKGPNQGHGHRCWSGNAWLEAKNLIQV